MHLFHPGFHGLGVQAQFSWVFCLGSDKAAVKMSAGAGVSSAGWVLSLPFVVVLSFPTLGEPRLAAPGGGPSPEAVS